MVLDQLVSTHENAGRAVLNAARRTDSKEYQDQVESRAMLRLANRERMQDWGFFGNSIICAAATIPYMGTVEIDELVLDLGGKTGFKSSMPTWVDEEARRTSSQERRVENNSSSPDKTPSTLPSGIKTFRLYSAESVFVSCAQLFSGSRRLDCHFLGFSCQLPYGTQCSKDAVKYSAK